jgi:hypothetical protein
MPNIQNTLIRNKLLSCYDKKEQHHFVIAIMRKIACFLSHAQFFFIFGMAII